MYDYASKVKEYFESYYANFPNDITLTLAHNAKVMTSEYPMSVAPIAKFDDFLSTVLYLPIELENVDDVFEIGQLYTQTETVESKTYLTLLNNLLSQIQSLSALFDISKFTLLEEDQ